MRQPVAGAERGPNAGAPDSDEAAVVLRSVTKRFGRVTAVDALDLAVRRGEMLSLLGPSGCGKTTTLRLVAGLEQLTSGELLIGGRAMSGIPPHQRNLALVPQQYAMFPHLTVFGNVAFGLRMRRLAKREIRRRVMEALELVQLGGYADRRPYQLSGGQQQRVALARAIVVEPTVLLLDEPLGALDRKLRSTMQVELKQLQQRVGLTTIFVTHDQEEALSLSDRIAVMAEGRVLQLGTPQHLYERPTSHFVANFLGTSNFLQGWARPTPGPYLEVDTPAGTLHARSDAMPATGDTVEVTFRPEAVAVTLEDPGDGNRVSGTVSSVLYLGTATQVQIALASGDVLTASQENAGDGPDVAVGDRVWCAWSRDATQVLSQEAAASTASQSERRIGE